MPAEQRVITFGFVTIGLIIAGLLLWAFGGDSSVEETIDSLKTDLYDPPAELAEGTKVFLGERGGALLAVDKRNGQRITEMELDCVPVFDGLIAANGRLFVSQKDGSVVCLK